MCGIAGQLRFDGAEVPLDEITRMTVLLAHRGPDEQGVYRDRPVGLGARRLRIQDLSEAGAQPMGNDDGSVWISYNGEIYNGKDLRDQLAARGHRFRSQSDTEVLLRGFEEWGTGILERINGMFAFAVWDAGRRSLLLARDRIGIKPLFYSLLGDRLVFASEIKSILESPAVPRTLDVEALGHYLGLNYVLAPATLFREVRQLPSGHYAEARADGRFRIERYWSLPHPAGQTRSAAAIAEFDELARDSVERRLISDVPLGAFLSGGLDSSAIVAWMHEIDRRQHKTFSIRFEEASYDETPFARIVARHVGADHHERTVSAADAVACLDQIVWHAEEPTADSSMVAMYHLSRLAREHVTVVLSGDGADEILAGYDTYTAFYLHRIYRLIPAALRQHAIAPLAARLPDSDSKVTSVERLKRFLAARGGDAEVHATWRQIFTLEERQALLEPLRDQGAAGDPAAAFAGAYRASGARRTLDRLLEVDLSLYLPNDMLIKVDRMSMAHGLEARVPFLDHRLVEFAAGMHPSLKLRRFVGRKHALRAAMASRLPAAIGRRGKAGFNVPKASWLRDPLRPIVEEYLSPGRIRETGVLSPSVVTALVDDHMTGRANRAHQIWGLLVFMMWWRRFQVRAHG